MLRFLGTGDQGRIEGAIAQKLHDTDLRIIDNAFDSVARFPVNRLSQRAKNLFEPRRVFLGLVVMMMKAKLEQFGRAIKLQFAQRADEQMLGVEDAAQLSKEKDVQIAKLVRLGEVSHGHLAKPRQFGLGALFLPKIFLQQSESRVVAQFLSPRT